MAQTMQIASSGPQVCFNITYFTTIYSQRKPMEANGGLQGPTTPLVNYHDHYYMSPPHTIKEAFLYPIHTSIYIIFMLSACVIFSKTWIEVSGSGPQDVAKQWARSVRQVP
jgi:preprotein translocase subunit SecY